MRIHTRIAIVLLVLALGLAACGASTAETDVSPANAPEDVTRQMLDALAIQDESTVLNLFDPDLPTRALEQERLLHDWETRQQTDAIMSRCPTFLGPLKSQDVAPAVMSGATAKVRTVLHHEKGDAWLEFSLRQASGGWRVIAWSSGNICPR